MEKKINECWHDFPITNCRLKNKNGITLIYIYIEKKPSMHPYIFRNEVFKKLMTKFKSEIFKLNESSPS